MNKSKESSFDSRFPLVGSGLGARYDSTKNPPAKPSDALSIEHATQICQCGLTGEMADVSLGTTPATLYKYIQETLDNAKMKNLKFFYISW